MQGLALPLDPSAPPVNTNFAAASSVHVGVFVIPGATKALNIPVVSTKVSQVNRHLGGILGRQFLGGCKLTYDGPAKSCELVYHEV